jgi:hypothetical protein
MGSRDTTALSSVGDAVRTLANAGHPPSPSVLYDRGHATATGSGSLQTGSASPPTGNVSPAQDVDCAGALVVPEAGVAPAPLPSLTPHQQMLSSGAGALLVCLFMTPLDVVKIRQVRVPVTVYGVRSRTFKHTELDIIVPVLTRYRFVRYI